MVCVWKTLSLKPCTYAAKLRMCEGCVRMIDGLRLEDAIFKVPYIRSIAADVRGMGCMYMLHV